MFFCVGLCLFVQNFTVLHGKVKPIVLEQVFCRRTIYTIKLSKSNSSPSQHGIAVCVHILYNVTRFPIGLMFSELFVYNTLIRICSCISSNIASQCILTYQNYRL